MDQCRCCRHQSPTAATARAKRLLAVTCLTMFLPFRDRPQTWVRPRKSKLVPSVSEWRAPSVICGRKSTRRVSRRLLGQRVTGGTGLFRRKAPTFVEWHEPDEARVSRPDLVQRG